MRFVTTMKGWVIPGLLCATGMSAMAASPAFTETIRPGDFAAAGLAKLTPEERLKLDALVNAFQREVAANAPPPAAPAGEKTKVVLKPGTEVEYATVESRIAGDFTGWEGRAVFKLENGQRWQLANPSESFYVPALKNPSVKILPAVTGGFWMKVEGVSRRVRVLPLRDATGS